MRKKALSILLALAMMLTMMPAMALTAFAGEDAAATDEVQVEAVAEEAVEAPVQAAPVKAPKNHNNFWWDNFFTPFNWQWELDKAKAWAKSNLNTFTAGYDQYSDIVKKDLEDACAAIDAVKYSDEGNAFDTIRDLTDAAVKEILGDVKNYAEDAVNEVAFYNPSFDKTSEGLDAAIKKALADIDAAEYPAQISATTFVPDFWAAKKALIDELNAKAANEAVQPTSAAVQAILDEFNGTEEDFWGRINKAKTYKELAALRDEAQERLELQIASEKYEQVLVVKAAASGRKAVKLSWNAVKGATSYTVYANRCGKKYVKVGTTKTTNFKLKKIGKKKLKAHKAYKFYVVANNGVQSRTLHFVTAKTMGKRANVKSIAATAQVNLSKASAKTGKIAASYKMPKHKKHLDKSHGVVFTYTSNNNYVASVDANGKITANHLGTAKITVQEMGGLAKTVTVVVGK